MSRILIVDDAMFMRAKLRMMLEANGHQVVGEAENGEIALQQYKKLTPDLVTMDITMPVVDGVHALRNIRDHDPKAKVLMISAMGQQSMVVEAVKAGANGFIVKPFQEEAVIKAISQAIAR